MTFLETNSGNLEVYGYAKGDGLCHKFFNLSAKFFTDAFGIKNHFYLGGGIWQGFIVYGFFKNLQNPPENKCTANLPQTTLGNSSITDHWNPGSKAVYHIYSTKAWIIEPDHKYVFGDFKICIINQTKKQNCWLTSNSGSKSNSLHNKSQSD